MKCSVLIRSRTESIVFANDVDLDYFNIRQWRLLYFRFFEMVRKYGYAEINIEPCNGESILLQNSEGCPQ